MLDINIRSNIMPATKISDIFGHFQTGAMKSGEFDDLYVDADEGRGEKAIERIKNKLDYSPDGSLKILFVGYRGCGKTTELLKLQKSCEKEYIIINFSVRLELDIISFSYIDLLIVAMEKLFGYIQNETKIIIDQKILDNIFDWTNTKEIQEIKDKFFGSEAEVSSEVSVGIPTIFKFFSKLRASARSSKSFKEIIRTNIEPRISELIDNCNLLLNEIKIQLPKTDKKGIIIIFEDLDKVDLEKGEEIFYNHAPQLTSLNCHCIFTFPIALLYNSKFNPIKVNYDDTQVLPMIKINSKDGKPFIKGRNLLKQIVYRRMNKDLFEDEKILDRMIKNTGGCLWDLFRMIKDAASTAQVYKREKISKEDYTYAFNRIKSDYKSQIADTKRFKAGEYLEVLQKLSLDRKARIQSTDILLDLKHNLSILQYNGEEWCEVHPIIKEILKERSSRKNIKH
jgi:hypothetical protein